MAWVVGGRSAPRVMVSPAIAPKGDAMPWWALDDCTTRDVTVDLNFDEKTRDETASPVPFFENVWQRTAWRPSGSTARTQSIARHACCRPVIPAPPKNSAGGIPVFLCGKSNWRATASKNSTAQRAGR